MIRAGKGGVYIEIYVQPGASKPGVVGIHDGALKMAVAPRAREGRANEAVVTAIANLLEVAPGDVTVVAGRTSRRKRVFARDVSRRMAENLIGQALTD